MSTIADILISSTERAPEQLAVVCDEFTFTQYQLLNQSLVLGRSLQLKGLRKGDRVMTCFQNHQHAVVLYWASQLYGFVICPVNWRSTSVDIDYYVADCNAQVLFYDDSAADAVARSGEVKRIACIAVPDQLNAASQPLQDASFDSRPIVSEDDLSIILYTSGTTGRPKGVLRTHRAERAATLAHVTQSRLTSGDTALGVMPLYHTMGVRMLICCSLLSGTFVCQKKFNPEQTLQLIARHRISSLFLVPTHYHDLVQTLSRHPTDISSVIRAGFAGATMSGGLLKKVTKVFANITLVNHYGSSEIYTYTINQDAARKPGSAGRPGLNARLAIIPVGSRDVNQKLDCGQEGQIIAKADSAESFNGYLNKPDADRKAFSDGWYLTGDVGYFDNEGDLFITGRVDDMIITGGENVMPVEIESVLSLHDRVAEVVVTGKPDERLGSQIVAYIVSDRTVGAEMLDAHCRNSGLPGFKCPRLYQFIDAIPKSPVGKVLRHML